MSQSLSRLSMLALEQRIVFDGAAPTEVTAVVTDAEPVTLFDRMASVATPTRLSEAEKETQRLVSQWMQQGDTVQKLAVMFGGENPDAQWVERAQSVVEGFRRGELSVRVELRAGSDLMGTWGAFAQQGPDGQPVIYLNADWVAAASTTSAEVTRVLAEEWGHFLDAQLNQNQDTQGDEGEAFALQLLGLSTTQQELDRIAVENDHVRITIDGVETEVEMASLLFSGQSYFASLSSTTTTAGLESNVLVVGAALPGTRTLFVSDPPDAAYYSGNNVRGTAYAIDDNNNIVASYYGEISRLIKDGSTPVAAQMYVYPQTNPIITNVNATTIILDFYKDRAPTLATGQIAKTSSDPVASALNSLLPVNQPPTANPDTGFALEAGGLNNTTAGALATGNVISGSDTDPNSTYVLDLVNMKLVTQQDKLSITQVSNASAGTSAPAVTTTGTTTVNGVAVATTSTSIAPIAGLYGTLTMGVDGTYSYAVNNDSTAVQALRGTTNTLSDVYTYTISDGKGGFSTATLTITVRGANDNPLAKDDYNFAKESIESTVANQYGGNDAFGQKATGNVLPNDTDVDGYSETKRVAGVSASATVSTVSATLTLNFTSVPSNVSVGRYVWLDSNNTLDNVTGTLLKDASGNPITVTAVTSTTATLSGVPVNAQGVPIDLTPNMILGFSNNTAGASYSEAQIKDAGIAPSNTLRVNALGTGQVAVGMTVSGDGVPAGTTITGITYNADGTINRITISSSIAVSSATLNFSAATFPMTLTGQYGTLVLQENGDYVYTPFANNPALNSGDMKVDAFRYNMWDAAGAVSTATLYINVMGSGPSDPDANADTVTAVEAGGTANTTAGNNPTGNLLSNDALGNVPSGATLSVVAVKTTETAPANASALTGSITFDGVTYAAKVTGQYGDLYVKADGTYRYVVNNTDPVVQALRLSSNQLTDNFQYKITNGSGFNWSSLTVTINGANDAPVAVNDSITAIVGEYVPVGNVLANDTDVDGGDTKTVTKIALGSTLPGSSNVTSSTTYSSGYTEIQGTYGTLRIGADGSFTYLVDANNATIKALGTGQLLASPDVFTYEMRDAAGLLSTATMTMNVEGRNDAPVNTLPATFTAQEGSSYAFTGAGNTLSASDIDNNLASTTVSVLNGTLAVSTAGSSAVMEGDVQVGITLAGRAVLYFDRAATVGGDLTLSGNGTSNFTLYGTQTQINAALASLVYTPNVGYVGSDTLKIESIDAEGLKDVDTVSVTVAAPTLTVTGTTVNEASPYTLFSVSGKEGQSLKLSLESTGTGAGYATLGTDTGLTLEYYNGSTWVTYNPALNGGYVVMPSDGDATSGENATLLVRVANVQDTTNEGAETLKLVATNAAGTAANDTSTIKDDGTGSYFAADNNTATSNVPADVTLDDDRPLTVNSITVNEGSPCAVFTVSGAAGQLASLNLAGQNSDGSNLSGLQYWDGDSWETYTSGTVALDSNGQLLVRVALSPEQETALDGPETFNLVATNTGGTSGTGQATIKDDGTGALYTAANPTVVSGVLTPVTDTSTPLDDDRALNVNSFEINEGSPYAVFTVTGASNQLTTLTLTNGTTTGMTGLEVYTGGAWVTYTGGTVALDSTGKLLVRTSMTPEQETGVDNGETFTLTATNTGGTGTPGTATVKDDGTGTKWSFSNVTTDPGTSTTGPGAGFDDDRVVTVSSPLVNEASPYAVFTVDGAQGQLVSLSLGTGTASSGTDYTASMEISTDGGLTWSAYSSGLTSLDGIGGTLLVRVPVKQDTTDEPGETFTLTATKTNAVATTGTATIVDDGNGDIFNADGSLNTTTVKDDDRPVTVTSVAVNEASPYAVLTVDGELNQLVSLSLVAGATNPATAAADYQSKIEYSTDNGSTWTVYTGGNVALAGTNGTMLVRVPVINDTTQEVDETFRLVATNTGGTSSLTSEGVVTIQDDGNGTIFNPSGTENTAAIKDDDRPLTVDNVTVNESTGPAVFTVTGVAGQLVKLELQSTGSGSGDALISGAGADIGSTLRYSLDGGSTWLTYNPATNGGFVAMTGTTMKVEVVVNRDALVESSETYQLAATNTGGSTALGTGTITDYAPPVTAVTSTAGEAGGTNNTTAGTPVASGDLATGVDLYSLKFGTADAVTSPASGTTYVDGAFGRLTFAKDGTWSYAATEGDPDVQALRLTSNTLTETFTYTVVDAYGAKSSNTLTITIQGANDAPVANPDYNTAKESLAGTTVNNNEFLNITAYSTLADATYDRLGYKATGDVLPNDTDVDAGDGKSIVGVYGAASASSGSSTVSLTNVPNGLSSLSGNTYPVYYLSGGTYTTVKAADGVTSINGTINGTGTNLTVSVSDTTNLSNGQDVYLLTGSNTYTLVGKVGTITATSSSTIAVANLSGTIAVGMTVGGTGLVTAPTVNSVTRDGSGNITSVTLSAAVTLSGSPLTFTAATGVTITGRYGTLSFAADAMGGYTYTPFANNSAISEGQSVSETFAYQMQDTLLASSKSTLTITVLGSGTNDPNAVADTATAVEKGGTGNGTSGTDPTGNVLTGDTTPAGSLVVVGGKSTSSASYSDLYVTNTGAVTNGSSSVTVTSAEGLSVGMSVQGTGIPDGTTITGISGTTLTLSKNATATGAATSLLFTQPAASSITLTGMYGSLLLHSDGSYTYTVNNDNPQVQALLLNTDTLTDQFNYKVANGYFSTGTNGSPAGLLLTDVATLTVTINGANDAPVLDLDTAIANNFTVNPATGIHYAASFTEGGSAVSLINGADLNLTDVDSTTFNKVTLSFDRDDLPNANEQLLIGGATLQLNTIAAATNVAFTLNSVNYTYTVAVDPTTHVVTLDFKGASGGTLTNVQAEALLDALKYSNTSDDPTGSPRVFSLSVTDAGGLSSNTATSTITVTPVNDPPVLDLDANNSSKAIGADYKGSFQVGGTSAAIADFDSAVTDLDNANIASATIVLTNAKVGDSLALDSTAFGSLSTKIAVSGLVTASADGSLTVALTTIGGQTATWADYEAAIEAIRFAATGTNYTDRVFDVTLSDGSAVSNTATATLAVLPDNRVLTVAGITVNEASPYVVFTVTGVAGSAGQRVSLELGNTGTTTVGTDTANAGTSVPLQYFDAAANGGTGGWVDYTPGTTVALPSSGPLLVRTAVVNDKLNEGSETLALIARNDAGAAATGNSTIVDNGTGSIYLANNNTATPNQPGDHGPDGGVSYPTLLDDDRPLTVSSVTVNEGSPYATFTVTGANGQKVLLDLANASGDTPEAAGGKAALGTPTLEYFDGTWKTYDASNPPVISGGTTLLVRVGITAERDTALDGPETFNLVATNTGGTSGTGEANIVDDGTGSYFAYDPSGTVSTPLTAPAPSALDDDRPITVTGGTYNEGSLRAVFTVDANPDQWLTFDAVDAAGNSKPTTGLGSAPIYYSLDGGATWALYAGNPVQAGTADVLVAVDITGEIDTGYEGEEQLQLQVNTGLSTAKSAYASIVDDGTGVKTAAITASSTNVTGTDVGGVKDDDRLLTVSDVTVNEGSPYVVFTVTGATGQTVLLNLANTAAANPGTDSIGGNAALGTTLPALEYFEGGIWKSYDASNPPKIATGTTTLLVRVAIGAEQEAALDGPESFTLVATNTGGTPNDTSGANPDGMATIKDDGTGSYFAASNNTATSNLPTGVVLDDDRPVTITSPFVNEASPFAVFTLDGEPGQLVSLNLAAGTAAGNIDYQTRVEYSTDSVTWTLYTGGNVPLDGPNGTLLVRVPIVNDSTQEPDETFTLTATNTGGTAVVGIATIQDDGNGTIFNDNGTVNTAAVKDDDRSLTIAPVTVNEASPFAVFTVSGAPNQLASLALNNLTTSGLSGLEYYDPATAKWEPYTPNSYIPLDNAGKLLVRVAINPEQESLQDGPETFNLVATNTGGTSGTGLGTVVDDGTGNCFAATNNTAVSSVPANVRLDDDRPLTVGNITVNEGSPVAVFTVTGAPGQVALLALGNAAAASPADDAIGGVAALGITLPTLQYYNPAGSGSWVNYDANNPPVLTAAGNLLVRVSITPESDGVFDGPETFQLSATNTGNSTGVGTATILDDGTGSYWIDDATAPATPAQLETATITLDDDRPITVVGGTYNEGSPRAVFTVTANAGQLLTLGVEKVATNLNAPSLSYSVDGGATWLLYTGAFVAGPVPVLVAVNITSERDEVYEVSEEFKLVVNPGMPTQAKASGFIVDNGTGAMYDAMGVPMSDSSVRDDDRPRLQVQGPASAVSEGSPAVFTVSLSKTLLADTTIDLALNPGTASTGDFAMDAVFYLDASGLEVPLGPVGGPYVIPAGVSTFYVRALTTQDNNYEGLESLRLVATLPADVGGDSNGADAGIIDDGTGVVYTGQVSASEGLLVNASARADDDRSVAVPAPLVAPAVQPAIPAPLPVSPPDVHVQLAVAEARTQSGASGVQGPQAMAMGSSSARSAVRALDALSDKYERATDPNLFVLPAVRDTRSAGLEAQAPAFDIQSGLLWHERMGVDGMSVLVAQAPTLADITLARLMAATQELAFYEPSAGDAAPVDMRLPEWLHTLKAAQIEEIRVAETVKPGAHSFSQKLRQASQRPDRVKS